MEPGISGSQAASGTTIGRRRKLSRASRSSRLEPKQIPVNTYRLTPRFCFQPQVISKILEEITPPVFDSVIEYDFNDFAVLCKYLNIQVLREVNKIYWPSYKIVVVVQCLEKADNCIRGSLRYYWNPKFDGLVNYIHQTDYYMVTVTAAFFYYE